MSASSGTYALTTYPWARAQRQVLKQAMSPAAWYGMWMAPILGVAWIVLCLVTPRQARVFGDPTPAIVGFLCAVVFLMLLRSRNMGLQAAINASAFRAGGWQVTLADDGLHLVSENVRQVFAWHAVSEVRDGPDGILIMLGPAVFLPVPATAFADGASLQAFQAELAARISATRGAA